MFVRGVKLLPGASIGLAESGDRGIAAREMQAEQTSALQSQVPVPAP